MAKKSKEEIEAMLARNDAGAEAVKRQQEATADVAVADKVATPEQEEQIEPEQKLTNPVDEIVVKDVIAGKYGTGSTRVQKLAEAGYNPDEVQSKVNETLKAKPAEEQANEIAEQENENVEDFQIGKKVEMEEEIPENVQAELDSSDEGQQAKTAVEANDPAALQNIVTPEGEAVLKGSYDKDGRYVPKVYSIDEAAKMQNKGWAGVATIISMALTAFGAMAGLPIMPINFYKVLGTEDYRDKLNEMEENYASVLNSSVTPAATTSNIRKAEQEANISDIEAYKNLEQPDIQKAASVNASVGGQNTQLEVQREAQEWEAKQKELDRDFQKVMNDLNTDSQIAVLKQQAINAKDLATLMQDLENQKIVKQIAYAEEAGLTRDELAKWLRAQKGITQFGAAIGYVGDAAKVAGDVAGTFLKSDKGVKKFVYDGKAANTKMFSKARPKW